MAKKAKAAYGSWGYSWGHDNQIESREEDLGNFQVNDDNGDSIVVVSQDGTDVRVEVGPVVLIVTKPTAKQKKDGHTYIVKVDEGLADESVVLSDVCGAVIPAPGDDE